MRIILTLSDIYYRFLARLAPPALPSSRPYRKCRGQHAFSFCEISVGGTPDRALTTYVEERPRSESIPVGFPLRKADTLHRVRDLLVLRCFVGFRSSEMICSKSSREGKSERISSAFIHLRRS
jgi:hypothetical protein